MNTVLTIAGSDSGAGAGIQADLKTFTAFKIYGTAAITAVTAQNTLGVNEVLVLPPDIVAKQIDAVMTDIGADAWKTGMLGNSEIIDVVVEKAKFYNIKSLVVDPVMESKNGKKLLTGGSDKNPILKIIPYSFIITPNCPEAEMITGYPVKNIADMKKAAVVIYKMGAKNVVVKGGHLADSEAAVDILYDGISFTEFVSPRFKTKNTHGTGCTFASAIAAGIARKYPVIKAVGNAKKFIGVAIKNADKLHIGHGFGPLNHFVMYQ
jgi:hydroxymethylpyrimidine/phosphomethylpyrimidine kinase